MPAGHAFETIIWLSRRRLTLVDAVLSKLSDVIKPIATGGPRDGAAKELATRLNCASDDDLRRLVIDRPPAFVLLTTMEGVTPESLTAAVRHGATVLTTEPIEATFEDLPSAPDAHGIIHIPAFTRSAGWLSAADPQIATGFVKNLSFHACASARDASLFALLRESWRLTLEFASLPESIDCTLAGGASSLRDITGVLSALARFSDGGSASIFLHEAVGSATMTAPIPFERELVLIGGQGRITATDTGYDLCNAAGQRLDHVIPAATDTHTFPDAVAAHWRQLIERPSLAHDQRGDEPRREAATIACCLASLLSARTGQPESPARIMTAHGL